VLEVCSPPSPKGRAEREQKKGEKRKMKKVFTVTLILMTILTTIYVSVVVYANTNANAYSHRYVLYGAFEYESETPPTDWYTPEQLGIYDVIEYGENASLHIAVDREKEPFPLQSENPIFLYKDKFYQVSPLWAGYGLPESVKQCQMPIGGALGVCWISIGVLFLKRRNEE
jgi:hypothetical protein